MALGGVVGVLSVRKLSKMAQAYTPENVSRSVASLADGLHDLAGAVREGMVEREQELRVALGVDASGVDASSVDARGTGSETG
jgi:hypothetical protein